MLRRRGRSLSDETHSTPQAIRDVANCGNFPAATLGTATEARPCRSELVGFRTKCGCSAIGVTTNDAPAHHQFQPASTLQQERPLHRQFHCAARRQSIVSLKQNAATADIERSAGPCPFDPASAQHLVLKIQRDRIPSPGTLVPLRLYRFPIAACSLHDSTCTGHVASVEPQGNIMAKRIRCNAHTSQPMNPRQIAFSRAAKPGVAAPQEPAGS